jgi:hypothetical protein
VSLCVEWRRRRPLRPLPDPESKLGVNWSGAGRGRAHQSQTQTRASAAAPAACINGAPVKLPNQHCWCDGAYTTSQLSASASTRSHSEASGRTRASCSHCVQYAATLSTKLTLVFTLSLGTCAYGAQWMVVPLGTGGQCSTGDAVDGSREHRSSAECAHTRCDVGSKPPVPGPAPATIGHVSIHIIPAAAIEIELGSGGGCRGRIAKVQR